MQSHYCVCPGLAGGHRVAHNFRQLAGANPVIVCRAPLTLQDNMLYCTQRPAYMPRPLVYTAAPCQARVPRQSRRGTMPTKTPNIRLGFGPECLCKGGGWGGPQRK